jgi:NADPH:quinone reductase-like Zn-dependent oxidoreductase
LAGEVEAVGKGVTRFKRGDRIVASTGMAGGGHAQYVCLPEKGALALKSESLTWEEAVCDSVGANTALYFLRNLGKIQAGQELLIIGASGSIGSAGVQLAKHFGATVTAVCSGANGNGEVPGRRQGYRLHHRGLHQGCKSLRPDIRHRRRELLQSLPTIAQAPWCLSSNIMGLTTLLRILWTSIVGGKKLKGGVAMEHPERMNLMSGLVATGRLKSVIDRSYPLARIAEAFKYVEQGHKKGNVVITVAHP